MTASTFVWYNNSDGSSSDYAWLPGHWLSEQAPPGEGSMYYQDSFGVQVVGGDFDPQAPMKRLPEYLKEDEAKLSYYLFEAFFTRQSGYRKCTIQEFRECKAFCKRWGGFYAGCYWLGNRKECVCGSAPEKPCYPSEMERCEAFCKSRRLPYKSCKKGPIGILDCDCLPPQGAGPLFAQLENAHE